MLLVRVYPPRAGRPTATNSNSTNSNMDIAIEAISYYRIIFCIKRRQVAFGYMGVAVLTRPSIVLESDSILEVNQQQNKSQGLGTHADAAVLQTDRKRLFGIETFIVLTVPAVKTPGGRRHQQRRKNTTNNKAALKQSI